MPPSIPLMCVCVSVILNLDVTQKTMHKAYFISCLYDHMFVLFTYLFSQICEANWLKLIPLLRLYDKKLSLTAN